VQVTGTGYRGHGYRERMTNLRTVTRMEKKLRQRSSQHSCLSEPSPVRHGNPMPTQRTIGFNANLTQTEFGLTQLRIGLRLGYPGVSPFDVGFGKKKDFFAATGVSACGGLTISLVAAVPAHVRATSCREAGVLLIPASAGTRKIHPSAIRKLKIEQAAMLSRLAVTGGQCAWPTSRRMKSKLPPREIAPALAW